MSLFQVTKKQVTENYELRTMTGDIVSFAPSYSQLLPDPFSDLNVTIDVEATGGNGTPDNPNPIIGYSSANITRCGVNLLHVNSRVSQQTYQGVTYSSDDNYMYMNGTKYSSTYANFPSLNVTLPAGTYYIKAFPISGTATHIPSIVPYNGSDVTANIMNNERTFTLSEPTTFYFRFALWTDNAVFTNYKIGIVISTASISEYSEYTGNTYTITFGQMVYGGTLDVTRGKLSVTHVKTILDENVGITQGAYGMNFQCNLLTGAKASVQSVLSGTLSDKLSEVKQTDTWGSDYTFSRVQNSATLIYFNLNSSITTIEDCLTFLESNPIEFVYELATPIEIDLTPEVISAIVGTNNVFADCGDVTVKCLI